VSARMHLHDGQQAASVLRAGMFHTTVLPFKMSKNPGDGSSNVQRVG